MQASRAQRRDQARVVAVALDEGAATCEDDAGMANVGPGEFHLGMIGGMYAIEVAETGGPEVLNYVERPQPTPGPGQVLIKADAIGVNFIDTYFRSGLYPREVPFVVGTEVCGTIAAVGDDVAALGVGDRVVTAQADGAYADFCLAPADFVAYVPDGVPAEVAASALLKGMTAHYLIKSTYPVQQGDTVLVHAGAGGVGLILTQWATSLAVRVITTVSTREKAELSRKAGAVEVLDYPDDPPSSARRSGTHRRQRRGRGVRRGWRVDVRGQPGQPRLRGTLPCSVRPAARFLRRPAATQQRGSLFLTRPTLAHHTRTPTNSAGVPANCSTRSPRAPRRHGQQPLPTRRRRRRAPRSAGPQTVGSVVLVP